jgi:hypothetical protein
LVKFVIKGINLRTLIALGRRLDWRKRANAGAATHRKLHALDRRVKLPFVRSELLQSADAAAGANDGDQIAGLHLLVNKLFQGSTDLVSALKRKTQIVNHQGNRPPNVLRLYAGRRHRRRSLVSCCGPDFRRRGRSLGNVE